MQSHMDAGSKAVITRNELHRTIKLDLDEGRAASIEEANALAATYRLQIHVGPDLAKNPTGQAALLTAVNAGGRAFLGGVRVSGNLDWDVTAGWHSGKPASRAIRLLGGSVVDELTDVLPTVLIGTTDDAAGSVIIQATWDGWAGGIVLADEKRLGECIDNPLAGIVAGAIAVSEAFAHARGSVTAGRQQSGLSLWRPNVDWRSPDAVGPELQYLPTRLWLGGLGHLGQAYLWALGLLPYQSRSDVMFVLQDFDHVVDANRSTGLLLDASTPNGLLKTRIAAAQLERLGFTSRLIERPFDSTTRPGPNEPTWLLAGFDNSTTRSYLGGFDFAVDVGLGGGADDYLGIHIHTFPEYGEPSKVFSAGSARADDGEPAPWAVAAANDRCGVLQLQGVAVGAAFVGAIAGALGVAEVLRALLGSKVTSVGSVSLNALGDIDWVGGDQQAHGNPGFQRANTRKG